MANAAYYQYRYSQEMTRNSNYPPIYQSYHYQNYAFENAANLSAAPENCENSEEILIPPNEDSGAESHMFESKAELQIHTQVHMREAKPYKCNTCPKSFANSSYLSQHMRIHLGLKPFGPCQYCGRKFTQLSHLQQHLRTHTGEKPYRCKFPSCEKAFSQLSNLQSHSRCHQTDKPFKCNSCYKCFSNEQDLLDHIPKHKESKHLKVHICPYCGKSYTQGTYLAKHMTKHNDRRDKDQRMREIMMGGRETEAMWMREPQPCPLHGVVDSCGDTTPSTPLHYSFPPHQMPLAQSCGYGSGGMGMGGVGDQSAFTPLNFLQSQAFNNAARNPYLSYDSFKSVPSTSLQASGYATKLLGLTKIKGYGEAHASSGTSSADIHSLMNREYANQMR